MDTDGGEQPRSDGPTPAPAGPCRGARSGDSEPALHRWADVASGGLLLGGLVSSPWMFGLWGEGSVWALNVAGYLLWLLLGVKAGVRRHQAYVAVRWDPSGAPGISRLLALLTAALLLWMLVSAVNARAVVDPDTLRLRELAGGVTWLPRSFDAPASWFQFWTGLGLAGVFWGARDWLSQLSRTERDRLALGMAVSREHPTHAGHPVPGQGGLPGRLSRLLWTCCLSGTLVALLGILGASDLPGRLGLPNPFPGRATGAFGPFPYRNNAAQYLNLIWPVGLALGFGYRRRRVRPGPGPARFAVGSTLGLLSGSGLMAAAPFVMTSRGGSLMVLVLLALCLPVLVLSARARGAAKLAPLVLAPLAAGLGLLVAWEPLSKRFLEEFRVLDTGVSGGLAEFTLRCSVELPDFREGRLANIALLSESREVGGATPNTVLLRILADGGVAVHFSVGQPAQVLMLRATNALPSVPGRRVELTLVQRHETSALYVDGTAVPLGFAGRSPAYAWPARFATRHLWMGRGDGANLIRGKIDAVTLVRRALEAAEVQTLWREGRETGSGRPSWGSGDAWDQVVPAPLLNVRLRQLSPAVWLAGGLGGRTRYYEHARQMLAGYPAWSGAGPGTFASLYAVFRGDRAAAHPGHVHDDYLETRFNFGWVGAALIYLALLVSTVPLGRGRGLPVPWPVGVCLLAGWGGCLLHAAFDYVFQTHPLLFLGVVFCSILSGSRLRRNPGAA